MDLQLTMAFLNVINILIGIYVGYRICEKTNTLVRWVIMLPSITSLVSINMYLANSYTGYLPDVLREISMLCLYGLIAIMLSGRRLLRNIGTQDRGICERKEAL